MQGIAVNIVAVVLFACTMPYACRLPWDGVSELPPPLRQPLRQQRSEAPLEEREPGVVAEAQLHALAPREAEREYRLKNQD